MIKKIVMPAAGQTTDISTVTEIKVAVGDKVSRGDELMEVETDKASLPIESVASGYVVRICVEEYDKIDAGTLLMEIGSEEDLKAAQNGDAPAEEPAAEETKQEEPAAPAAVEAPAVAEASAAPVAVPVSAAPAAKQEAAGPKAMPAAKKAAAELGVDLEKVSPANGEFIKKSDVLAAAGTAVVPLTDVIPTSVMRDSLSAKLEKFAVTVSSVSMDVCAEAAERVCAAAGAVPGDLVMLALSRLEDRFPFVAARYEKGVLNKTACCNFGLAFTGINGTVSAVCPAVEAKNLRAVAAVNRENAALIAKGDMSPVCGGSLTVYDLSASACDGFVPTLSTPEVLSVGIGGIKARPYVTAEGTLAVHRSFTLTLAYDARVTDAPVAAELLSQLAAFAEDPALMI